MRIVYTVIESRRYGTLTLSWCYDDGNSSPTYVRIPEQCVHASTLTIKRGFDAIPLGLERVPQLEVKLANNATVRNEIIAPLLRDDKRVYVVLDRSVDGSGYPVRDKTRTPGGQIIYIGVASSRIELDVAKDRDITMVADDAVHWWLDQLTAADLYATITTSSPYTTDVIGPIAGYEAHPEAGFDYFAIGTNPVRGMRWFDNYYALPLSLYLRAYYDTAWARVLADMGALLPSPGVVLQPIAPLKPYRMQSQTLTAQPNDTLYIYTHYQSSDPVKRYWGALYGVYQARSLRDALKDTLESLGIAAHIRYETGSASWSIAPRWEWVRPLQTTSQQLPKTWAITSHKLANNVISSVTMTCDAWHGANNRDITLSRSKRYMDFGIRLLAHNVPMLPAKQYIKLDGSNWVARPEDYYRNGIRRLAFGDGVRAWTVLPELTPAGDTMLSGVTVDGITYSYTLPANPGMYGYEHSMARTLPDYLLMVWGRPSLARVEYTDTSGALYDVLGDKYGTDYVIGQTINLSSCISTIECVRYAV
ncbi:MAG: hypothetical protein KatS3mg038_1105 [Candidatus Kapaibacterium sp.]|nr:MAG: hypothetical protein KatS3mg038_1105 [Candidatus Kapabacteria bacterium]